LKYIIGISCFYHDSAASILRDGKIIACAQEERFTRVKHDSSFPFESIKFCLKYCKISLSEVSAVVFYEKPLIKFERLLETYIAFFPKGLKSFIVSLPLWIKEKLFQKKIIHDNLKTIDNKFPLNKIKFSEHHLSHAASAFFPSPFNEAIVLTADGVGEWATTTVAIGKNNKLKILKEINFPHSLGLLYSAFTYYSGFKVNSGEYKLMGLAPYGRAIYEDKIKENLIDIKDDGTFNLEQKYFNYATGLTMTNDNFHNLFGALPRDPKTEKLTQFHMDIAASVQKVTEEVMIKLAKSVKKEFNIDNLCLAGGVALNCVANGKIARENIFKNIWIQPASGDAGGSLGAALTYFYENNLNDRDVNITDDMLGSYLGPAFTQNEIEVELKKIGAKFQVYDEEKLIFKTADDLFKNKAIGWFQGRMEFGPRALGGRSILANPKSTETQKNLNLKVKYRESFRPFAPSILKENVSDWFDISLESPYMLLVANIKENKKIEMTQEEKKLFGIDKLNIKRSEIPAVTHVDYSARIQTVDIKKNPLYYKLIKKFNKISGCPLLVNTSFNVRGEPIVNTPKDAFECFMGTELDSLVIGNCYLDKKDQNKELKKDYKEKFELD
jgi:carbamoyltransferase